MKPLRRAIAFLKSIHLTNRFFIGLGIIASLFALSFGLPLLFPITQGLLVLFTVTVIADLIVIYASDHPVSTQRKMAKMLSLSDPNPISLTIHNRSNTVVDLTIYDELPAQLQRRDFKMDIRLNPGESRILKYEVQPLERGEYFFGKTNVLIRSQLGLVMRHWRSGNGQMTPVVPSIIQMKKYELLAFAKTSTYEGIKKIRRIGHSYEFEQIKQYVQGDDLRSINWKATGRRTQPMVNQYQDERSQQVYTIIDKSRAMHMPFGGLSLLDYAINTSLAISNIALKKHDRVGLISFSDKIGSTFRAERSEKQLKKILNGLYAEKAHVREANYDLLYRSVKNVIKSRSLVFLYTNFESIYAMERALPVLQRINHQHLLVVMIFENTELVEHSRKQATYLTDIYTQTIAERMVLEKKQMVMKLKKYGIQTILSRPEDLSMDTVNKYIELKARGLI